MDETYVFQTVEVLIPLVAVLALMRLLLFHSSLPRIRRGRLGVNDREGAVSVLVQLLILVAVLLVVPALS